MRIGIGYDIHPLKQSVPLVLGGAQIPFHSGLEGHSDGDSLTHAIVDAILGAMNSGNIGEYFPSDDPKFENARSIEFLDTIHGLLSENKWRLSNLDATIICEHPPLSSFIGSMRQNIALKLQVSSDRISIKAKSNNRLGYLGEGEGIAAIAVVLIEDSQL